MKIKVKWLFNHSHFEKVEMINQYVSSNEMQQWALKSNEMLEH